MKTCHYCFRELPLSSFNKSKACKFGVANMCRQCKSAIARAYRETPHGKEMKKKWAHKERHYNLPPDATKTCNICHQELPVESFNKDTDGKMGLASDCKCCRKQRMVEYAKSDRRAKSAEQYKATHTTRTCSKCHRELPLDSFDAEKKSASGLQTVCKECVYKRVKALNQTPEGKKEAVIRARRYQQTDKGKAKRQEYISKGLVDAWYKKYMESAKSKETLAKYMQTEAYKEQVLRYRTSPKGQAAIASASHRRRSRLKVVPITLTAEQWEEIKLRYKHKCVYCGEKKPLTRDCIIPISKGGGYTKENVVPACRSCNARKNAKMVLLQLLVI